MQQWLLEIFQDHPLTCFWRLLESEEIYLEETLIWFLFICVQLTRINSVEFLFTFKRLFPRIALNICEQIISSISKPQLNLPIMENLKFHTLFWFNECYQSLQNSFENWSTIGVEKKADVWCKCKQQTASNQVWAPPAAGARLTHCVPNVEIIPGFPFSGDICFRIGNIPEESGGLAGIHVHVPGLPGGDHQPQQLLHTELLVISPPQQDLSLHQPGFNIDSSFVNT